MLLEIYYTIGLLSLSCTSLPYCTTTPNNDGTALRASVVCGGGNVFSAQTAVHELGHIFLHQTANTTPVGTEQPCALGVGFINCMEENIGSGFANTFIFGGRGERFYREDIRLEIAFVDPNNSLLSVTESTFPYDQCRSRFELVAGTEECFNQAQDNREPATTSALDDWKRGDNGWDIKAQKSASCIVVVLPQADLPHDFSTFQQNPCFVRNWIIINSTLSANDKSKLATTEQEEAGADMFLNWVYFTTNPNSGAFNDNLPPPQNPPLEYANQGANGAGDVRWIWMNDKMTKFFTYFGW